MAEVFYANSAELATLTNTFTVDDTPTDPTTVSLVVTDPAGEATTYTYAGAQITKASAGVYTKDIACATAGVWSYVWVGTGTASDVTAGTWTVQSTTLGQLYCTPEELRSRVGLTSDATYREAEALGAVTAVSRWIEAHCERVFYRSTDTRTFTPTSAGRLFVDDLVSVTSVKTDTAGDGSYATTWAASDYQLWPVNPSAGPETRPYTSIRAVGSYAFPTPCSGRTNTVQIVGVYGWPAVPAPVREAAAIWATDLLKLGTMAFGIAGYGEYGAVRARPNPIVEALLAPYRRNPVKVA